MRAASFGEGPHQHELATHARRLTRSFAAPSLFAVFAVSTLRQANIVAVLAEVGVAAPVGETGVDLQAERPVGHSTHNLFVKDKKSKKLFMICHRQSAKCDLKTLSKELGVKELRMARVSDPPPSLSLSLSLP
jgi:hypothetical protein